MKPLIGLIFALGVALPRPPAPIIALPPCDVSVLLRDLDQYMDPAPTPPPRIAPMYCSPRVCAAKAEAEAKAREAALLRKIDHMRLSCKQAGW